MSKTPSEPVATEDAESPGTLGCLGFLIQIGILSVFWLTICFILYWKVSERAAAIGFFVPPLGVATWVMFRGPILEWHGKRVRGKGGFVDVGSDGEGE